jgi:phospholipase C
MGRPNAKVEHVVVLMLENRSFDHALGFLKRLDPRIEGLRGDESNPRSLIDPTAGSVRVSDDARYIGDLRVDPGHSLRDVLLQVDGLRPRDADGQCYGFVASYAEQIFVSDGAPIMKCFSPERLPALSTLAREFAVCDHWFSSVPGPTWPNRLFVHAATSDGHVDDLPRRYPMPTVFDLLTQVGEPWRIYFHDIPVALLLESLRKDVFKDAFRRFDAFLEDARAGTLPSYSFIEPRYTELFTWKANDQHPDHDVQLGEDLIADVYDAVRASPCWERTLLLVVYDEHGGTFDHVSPPRAMSPDGKTWSENGTTFAFDRLGPRVPAIVVSPFVPKATVDATTYDHTSIVATLRKCFELPHALTARDAAAATFDTLLALDAPRADTPLTLPRHAVERNLLREVEMTIEHVVAACEASLASTRPVTDLQRSLVSLARSLDVAENPIERVLAGARIIATEHDAALMVRERMARFFGR